MKAIKSVLANRKMFRGGGLVPTGNPMQNRNQASGILSSSDSLIDAVANDALSSQGGPTLAMNQGGVARFANGGLPNDFFFNPAGKRQGPVIPEYRPGIGMGVPRTRRADVTYPSRGGTVVRNRPVTEYEHFASPEEWESMLYATDTEYGPRDRSLGLANRQDPSSTRTAAEERYELMFPYSAQVDQSFMSMNPPIPDEITSQEAWIGEGPPRRITEIASIIPRTIDFLGKLGMRATYEGGKELHNAFEYLMQRSGSDLGYGKIRVLTNMIAAQPEFAIEIGEASNQVLGTEEGPGLSSNDFRLAVSETFFEKQKQITDAYQGLPGSEEGAGLVGAEWVSEKVMADRDPVSQRETRMALLGQEGSISPDDLSAYQAVMGDPAAQQTFIRELTATKGDEYVAALLAQVPEFTEEDGIVVTADRIREDDPESFYTERDRARDTSVAGFFDESVQPAESIPDVTQSDEVEGVDQEALAEGLMKQGEFVAERDIDFGEKDTLEESANKQRHNTLLESVQEAANAGNEEETKKTLETYIEEFKSAIPDYEGKSEWEQGMDIVKMGMAIAAGQDPNAITNISKGVLATIDNFTDDEKAKREYKQQIAISAGKYAIESVRKDRDAAAADLRKANWLAFTEDYTDPATGRKYKRGDSFRLSDADYLSGNFTDYPLGLPDIVEAQIDKEAAGLKVIGDANQSLIDSLNIGNKGMTTLRASQGAHAEAITGVRNGHILVGLLDSIIISNVGEDGKSKITGAYPWMKDKMDSLANAFDDTFFGDLDKLKNTDIKAYESRLQFVANRMVKELLGEGSRNISNIDRQLAEEIVGLLKNRGTIFASPDVMHENLQRIRGQLMEGIIDKYNVIDREENNWMERNFVGRKEGPTDQMIRERQRSLEGSFEGITSGFTGEQIVVDYKSIIDPDSGRLIKNWETMLK